MTSYSWQLYQKEKKGFIQYISDQHRQSDIIMTSGGVPDMRYVQNKKVFSEYLKQQKSNDKIVVQPYDCAICLETINDSMCLLKCKHSFCISCYSEHIRLKNTCPLCRDEICSKPKKMIKISDEGITRLINDEIAKKYPDRDNQTLEDFIKYHVPNCLSARMVMSEIKQTIRDVSSGVADFYENL